MSARQGAPNDKAVCDPTGRTEALPEDGEQVDRDVMALRERATFYDLEAHHAQSAQVGPAQEQARRLHAQADRLIADSLRPITVT